jgi:flagellum-specific peptidoglycan hydrolase FlgJ
MDKAISRAKKTAGVALSNEIYKTDPVFAKKYYNALIEKYGLQEIKGYQQ